MAIEDLATELRVFVVENFLFGVEDPPLQEDDSLLDQGILDSTGVLQLVGFLETSFGIQVRDDEIVPENLDSLTRLNRFVTAKLHASKYLGS